MKPRPESGCAFAAAIVWGSGEEIVDAHPTITEEQVRAGLAYAADSLKRDEVVLLAPETANEPGANLEAAVDVFAVSDVDHEDQQHIVGD